MGAGVHNGFPHTSFHQLTVAVQGDDFMLLAANFGGKGATGGNAQSLAQGSGTHFPALQVNVGVGLERAGVTAVGSRFLHRVIPLHVQ